MCDKNVMHAKMCDKMSCTPRCVTINVTRLEPAVILMRLKTRDIFVMHLYVHDCRGFEFAV